MRTDQSLDEDININAVIVKSQRTYLTHLCDFFFYWLSFVSKLNQQSSPNASAFGLDVLLLLSPLTNLREFSKNLIRVIFSPMELKKI